MISREIIFPENISSTIELLVKKYKLANNKNKKIQSELIEEDFFSLEDLAAEKMSQLVRDIAEKKIPEEDYSSNIQSLFDIQKSTADALVNEINRDILSRSKKTIFKEDKNEHTQTTAFREKGNSSIETNFKNQGESPKTTNSTNPQDVYREPAN